MASVCAILPSWKLPFRISFVMTSLGVCSHFTRRTSTISWVASDIRRSSTVAERASFFHQTCSQCFNVTRVQCAHHLKFFITGTRQSSGHHVRDSKMCGACVKLHLERRAQGMWQECETCDSEVFGIVSGGTRALLHFGAYTRTAPRLETGASCCKARTCATECYDIADKDPSFLDTWPVFSPSNRDCFVSSFPQLHDVAIFHSFKRCINKPASCTPKARCSREREREREKRETERDAVPKSIPEMELEHDGTRRRLPLLTIKTEAETVQ